MGISRHMQIVEDLAVELDMLFGGGETTAPGRGINGSVG